MTGGTPPEGPVPEGPAPSVSVPSVPVPDVHLPLVPVHPEAGAEESELVWVTYALPQAALYAVCPGGDATAGQPGIQLRQLVATGVLERAFVAAPARDATAAAARLTTRLSPGQGWSEVGVQVRAAVRFFIQTLAEAHAATHRARAGVHRGDAEIAAAAQQALAAEVGTFAASHGGSIDLLGVADGTVYVSLHGACHGCPAAAFTLQRRLAAAIGDRCGAEPAVVQGRPPAS